MRQRDEHMKTIMKKSNLTNDVLKKSSLKDLIKLLKKEEAHLACLSEKCGFSPFVARNAIDEGRLNETWEVCELLLQDNLVYYLKKSIEIIKERDNED